MSRRRNAHLTASVIAAALALPSVAFGDSGGAGLGAAISPSPSTAVQPANVTVTASGNGISISTRATALLDRSLHFTGSVAGAAGHVVEIERLGAETGWSWAPTVHAKAGANGSFDAVWTTNHIGRFQIRAVIQSGASAAAASPTIQITVYRPSIATFYGPGFWGQRTACGEILHRSTLGVANRTLKCGTPVALYYQGKTIVVPVIDRGPYANGADWDLTMATASALGMNSTATIGAVSLPKGP